MQKTKSLSGIQYGIVDHLFTSDGHDIIKGSKTSNSGSIPNIDASIDNGMSGNSIAIPMLMPMEEKESDLTSNSTNNAISIPDIQRDMSSIDTIQNGSTNSISEIIPDFIHP